MLNIKTTYQGKPISEDELAKREDLWDLYPNRAIVAQVHGFDVKADILVTENGWFRNGVRQVDPPQRWRPVV